MEWNELKEKLMKTFEIVKWTFVGMVVVYVVWKVGLIIWRIAAR